MASRLTLMPVLDAAATRAAEERAVAGGVPWLDLMERAGAAAAQAVLAFGCPRHVLVACGTGNNGGDGYVVARHLRAAGIDVRVAVTGAPATDNARSMAARWDGPVETIADAPPATGIVDAVFGIGLSRAVDPPTQAALARLGAAARVRIALDVPSGIDSDSGRDLGAAIPADLTIAFGTRKAAHVLSPGRGWCGRVAVADIGLGPLANDACLFHVDGVAPFGPSPAAHKYARGAVLVLGGPAGQGGAARLAARAALRTGAGLVTLAVPRLSLAENAARLDAVMVRAADDAADIDAIVARQRFASIAAGPGLGHDPERLASVLRTGLPIVLDADALTAFAGEPTRLRSSLTGPAVLTPHDGEFARLLGALPGTRIDRVRTAAMLTGAVVLLKGPETIVAAPDSRAAINTHATPYLATAGSGDVLTGIIAALLAQGFDPFEAACAGAWLHGDAGWRRGAGLMAEDLPEMMPAVLGDLT